MEGGANTTMSLAEALAFAVERHRQGRFEEAAHVYRQILAVVPDHADALHFLGVAEHQGGDRTRALELLNRALALEPDHADALSNRGNVYRSLQRLDEAEADYRRALALRPDDATTLSNLGTVLRARGDWEGAVAIFREVIARKPEHATAWQNLASVLEGMDRAAEAVEAYREAARLSPESAAMCRNLGIALYMAGRIEEAAEMYRRCLALAPDDARARHLLAACTGKDTPPRASDEYVRTEFDHLAADFDAKLASLEYRGPALVAEAVDEIAATLPPRLAVLDAGCGTGLCAPLLRPRATRLVGVDLSPAMVALARERGGYDELVVAELTAFLRQHERSYDLVVSADTLVYFGDLAEFAAASAGALRPGGALIFTLERAEPGEAEAGYRLNPHGRYSHTRDYVARVLAGAGFVDTAIREISSRKEVEKWVPGHLVRARLGRGC
ncbi:MAG: tetratricopeptide repeat protein [Deltaproteobacteria bacterium]|nr:tetratricopeptide repeat protein [Deltaproteobacteria bacterium]